MMLVPLICRDFHVDFCEHHACTILVVLIQAHPNKRTLTSKYAYCCQLF